MEKLALFGGTPVRSESFPSWPRVNKDLTESILYTINNEGWGVGSEAIDRFNKAFAEFHDARYCIATNSGTSALWVALKAAGVRAGDEVIIPSYTFIATASAVLMANAVPVFVDVESDTFNINPDLIDVAVTPKTKAIIPVHVAGNPANMDKILAVAEKHDLNVIEDAAQAHGAEWKGKKIGTLGLGGIFSFQTSKNMTAGEGGAIVSNDEEFINNCFSYHNCGRVKGGKWYEHRHLGGNFRLNAMAASMLFPQIKSLRKDMNLRDKNKQLLDTALTQIAGITTVKMYPETTRSANHLYICRYDRSKFNDIPREMFFKAMQAEGVYTYAGYVPLYKERLFIINSDEYPWLANCDYSALSMPVTERLCYEEAVWLKQNHLLGSDDDIRDVINAFQKVTTVLREQPELFQNLLDNQP